MVVIPDAETDSFATDPCSVVADIVDDANENGDTFQDKVVFNVPCSSKVWSMSEVHLLTATSVEGKRSTEICEAMRLRWTGVFIPDLILESFTGRTYVNLLLSHSSHVIVAVAEKARNMYGRYGTIPGTIPSQSLWYGMVQYQSPYHTVVVAIKEHFFFRHSYLVREPLKISYVTT